MPVSAKPLAATAMLVPTFCVAKVPEPAAVESETVEASAPRSPDRVAPLLLSTSAVLPLYTLPVAATPDKVTVAGVMFAVRPGGCTSW